MLICLDIPYSSLNALQVNLISPHISTNLLAPRIPCPAFFERCLTGKIADCPSQKPVFRKVLDDIRPQVGWQKNSQTSDTSLILLSLRRGNQRHKGLEVVSCKWPQTPRAKDAPNTGLGLPHWISFTPAPLGSQTCTFFTSAAQQPHPGKSGRRHGLDLCPGFHGNTGSCRRSSINLEHWLTELSTFPFPDKRKT